MKKKIIFAFVVIAVGCAFAAYKVLYKEHRNISLENATFSISVKTLEQEFLANDSLANAKFADKTIEVHGKITNIDAASNSITIDEKLEAVLFVKDNGLQLQQQVHVKGRFVGYDDLLGEFKMDQVSPLK
ncbi:hypothetical protein FNO01nite_27110 [Flavobacterium noncentrifugens]|uniref:tRNA_anti-like n=1 Tax=Flavobacterium noncentrifugens TaxID=1128970 RepID=A0A1G9CIE8_9FLAO|nr:hypothetical protein [Flavobacterium noncentrifugens]GEP52039.1 hypothetical protein FNO01nite_27110 [Flavobacterium noncentrifugens]SDK51175.1 tRNA_anti-like [Flavobacterium noncentrifugens]